MASGDSCQFGRDIYGQSNFSVVHWDCDDYPDGTITDVRTGEVVGRKEVTR